MHARKGSDHVLSTTLLFLVALAVPCRAQNSDVPGRLDLGDLPAYRKALDSQPAADPPVAASFHDLWDHPRALQGRRVVVEGRIVRMFHQGPVGEFPALVELWLAAAAGDLMCATCPEPEAELLPQSGQWVAFTGTYFRRITYPARDGPRSAPLLVGPGPPIKVEKHAQSAPRPEPGPASAWTPLGFGVVLGISVLACAVAWRLRAAAWSSRKSRSPRDAEPDPPIQFIEDEEPNR